MNSLNVIARIGRDAELRQTQGGTSICNFTAAFDSGFGDKKVTTWIRATIWGKRGESLCQFLLKGSQVGLSGELSNREYTKDGVTKMSLELDVKEVTLIGGKPAQQSPEARGPDHQARVPHQKAVDDGFEPDGDIPF